MQACMFRQSVRRAMKGITTKLEQVQGTPADTVTMQKLSTQIGTVVQQLAEVVHKLHLVRATDTMHLHCTCVMSKAAHTCLEADPCSAPHVLSESALKH